MAKAAAKKKPSRARSEDFAASVDRLANDNVFLEALALLAHVAVSKFSDHLPLHRQSENDLLPWNWPALRQQKAA